MKSWRVEDVRAYVERSWDALERTATVRDPAASIAVGDALREQAAAQVPGWPHAEDRRADLESHVRVAALFSRAHRVQLGPPRHR